MLQEIKKNKTVMRNFQDLCLQYPFKFENTLATTQSFYGFLTAPSHF